jgi:hypothetical protein
MVMTTMTRLKKKTPSEDNTFPSLFLVFDVKGGEEDFIRYYITYFLGLKYEQSTMLDILYSS